MIHVVFARQAQIAALFVCACVCVWQPPLSYLSHSFPLLLYSLLLNSTPMASADPRGSKRKADDAETPSPASAAPQLPRRIKVLLCRALSGLLAVWLVLTRPLFMHSL